MQQQAHSSKQHHTSALAQGLSWGGCVDVCCQVCGLLWACGRWLLVCKESCVCFEGVGASRVGCSGACPFDGACSGHCSDRGMSQGQLADGMCSRRACQHASSGVVVNCPACPVGMLTECQHPPSGIELCAHACLLRCRTGQSTCTARAVSWCGSSAHWNFSPHARAGC